MTAISIPIEGRVTNLEFTEAVLHLTGEFAGNLDFSIKSSGKLSTKGILKNLRMRVPGQDKLLTVAGYGESNCGMDITVYTELVPPGEEVPTRMAPDNVEIFWLEQSRDEPVGDLSIRAEKE